MGGTSVGSGGVSTATSATTKATGGAPGSSSDASGGRTTTVGGSSAGGKVEAGGSKATGGVNGGQPGTAGKSGATTPGGQSAKGGSSAAGGSVSTGTGPCTASKTVNGNLSGKGPHKVVMESNPDIACGTIYRPQDLGGTEKYPIFVWGEGGCSRSGTSNQASMAEIASHGYFVVADGAASGGNCPTISMPSTASDLPNMAKPLLDYVTWAIAENGKSCSAYRDSMDTTKVAADGFSCGGLMAAGTASDPRIVAFGITSSGLTSPDQNYYKKIHTPVKILLGGSGDVAYPNGTRDYTNISALGIPVIMLSKDGAGHGGDLSKGTGDFNSVNLAWLNWQLKGDTGATGKGALYGSTCKYCTAAGWEYKAANIE
jgi:hypothetical protein